MRAVPIAILLAACRDGSEPTPPATGAVVQASTCSPTDLYSAPDTAPRAPHEVFCGNQPKTIWGASTNYGCSGSLCCWSQSDVRTEAGDRVLAEERVEVRGWIDYVEGYKDAVYGQAEEYIFTLRLDFDWDPSPCLPSNITPINSLAAFARAFTPFNDQGFRIATSSGYAFGGGDDPGDANHGHNPKLKIEVNGWYPSGRMQIWNRAAPSKWTTVASSRTISPASPAPSSAVKWPFDPNRPPSDPPSNKQLGETANEYVRLVGTLWEDDNHQLDGNIGCWDNDTTQDRGWKELHPVDFMARIQRQPRPYETSSTFGYLAVCGNATVSNWEIRAPAKPYSNWVLDYQAIFPAGFTTWSHLSPNHSITQASNASYGVSVGTQNWNSPFTKHGRFFGVYRVFWHAPCVPLTRAQACGSRECGRVSDGCYHEISCGTCGSNETCNGAQRCVCQSGYQDCGGVCISNSNDCQ